MNSNKPFDLAIVINDLIAQGLIAKRYDLLLEKLYLFAQEGYLRAMYKLSEFITQPNKAKIIGINDHRVVKTEILLKIKEPVASQQEWAIKLLQMISDQDVIYFYDKIVPNLKLNRLSKEFSSYFVPWQHFKDPQLYLSLITILRDNQEKYLTSRKHQSLGILALDKCLQLFNQDTEILYRQEIGAKIYSYVNNSLIISDTDVAMGANYCLLSSQLGYPPAMITVANLVEGEHSERTYIKRLALYRKAYTLTQDSEAGYKLGKLTLEGYPGFIGPNSELGKSILEECKHKEAYYLLGTISTGEKSINYYQLADTSAAHLKLADHFLQNSDYSTALSYFLRIYMIDSTFVLENFTLLFLNRQEYNLNLDYFTLFLEHIEDNETKLIQFLEILYQKIISDDEITDRELEHKMLFRYINIKFYDKKIDGVTGVDKTLIKYCQYLSGKNNNEATYILGLHYHKNKDSRSLDYFQLAVEQGHVQATRYVARYFVELTTKLTHKPIIENTVKYLKLAIEDSCGNSAYNLGCLYRDGFYNQKPDFDQAKHWFTQAYEFGYDKAMYTLGILCQSRGQYDQAEYCYNICIKEHHTKGWYALGYLLSRYKGKHKEAIPYLKEACENGNYLSLFELARIYAYYLKNAKEAQFYIEIFSALDHSKKIPGHQNELNNLRLFISMTNYKLPVSVKKQLNKLRKKKIWSANNSNNIKNNIKDSLLNKKLIVKEKEIISEDRILKLEYFQRWLDLAQKGDVFASGAVGMWLVLGANYQPRDLIRGMIYLSSAARQGDIEAAKMAYEIVKENPELDNLEEYEKLVKQSHVLQPPYQMTSWKKWQPSC